MGAYAPAPIVTPAIMDRIMQETLRPTIDGMRKEGMFINRDFTKRNLHHLSSRLPVRWSTLCRTYAHRKRSESA